MLRMAVLVFSFLMLSLQQDCSAEGVWQPLSSGIVDLDICSISIFPGDDNLIGAASSKRVYFSENGANFWREIFSLAGGEGEINFVSFSRSNSKIIYLATTKGLFAAVNQGEDWRRIFRSVREAANNVTWIALDSFDYRKIYIGTEEGLFYSQDSGDTWRKAAAGLPRSEVKSVAVHPTNSSVLYLANTHGLFKTIDAGQSWERIYVTSLRMTAEEESSEIGERQSLINCIAVDKHRPEKIFITTDTGVLISPDAGETWNRLPTQGLSSNYINFIVASSDKKDAVYAATKNGVFKFLSHLNRWQEIYQGMSARDVHTLALNKDGKQLFAGTDRGVFRATDLKIKIAQKREAKVEINRRDKIEIEFKRVLKELSQNEPTVREVQEAALRYAEVVHPNRIKTLRRNAKLKALLPDVDINYDKTIKDGGTTANFGKFIVGPRDWGLTLSWDVGDLVFSEQVRLLNSNTRLMVQLRDDILNEITRLYYERRKLQTEFILTPPKSVQDKLTQTLRLEELTANIDALTGGYFSRQSKP